jgi:N6-adenosine-specific RNA methylase IME4
MPVLPLDPSEWPEKRYKVVYLDPPWQYDGDPDKPQAAGKHYNGMSLAEMTTLPVPRLLDRPGVVLMWATSPKLDVALDLIRAWKLHYRGVAYVWVKTTEDGRIIHGQGVRPSITKPTTEYVLAASTQASGRPLKVLDESQGQVVLAPRPGGQHSTKPDVFRLLIEDLWGPVPRIELFRRGPALPGWDAWGNEAGDLIVPIELAGSTKLRERLEAEREEQAQRDAFTQMLELPEE